MRFEDAFIEFMHKCIMLSGSNSPINEIAVHADLFERINNELMSKIKYESWSINKSNEITLLGVSIKVRTNDN